MNEWIKKTQYIYKIKYYSSLKNGNWAAGLALWTKGWLSHCPECGFPHQHVTTCLPPPYQGKETGESLPLKGCPAGWISELHVQWGILSQKLRLSWINGSAVLSTGCSSRVPRVQHAHSGSQPSVIPVLGNLILSPDLHRHCTHMGQTHMQAKHPKAQ